MSCNYPPTYEIARNVTLAVFEAIIEALGLAVFNIALTVQAYVSTALRAEEVLVWMPLTLVIDIGAMIQMVVLIIEMHRDGDTRKKGLSVLWGALKQASRDVREAVATNMLQTRRQNVEAAQEGIPMSERQDSLVRQDGPQVAGHPPQVQNIEALASAQTSHNNDLATGVAAEAQDAQQPLLSGEAQQNQVDNAPSPPGQGVNQQAAAVGDVEAIVRDRVRHNRDALHYAIVALVAFILGVMLLVLQIIGFYYAVKGRHRKDISVNWCSPAFRDFAIAVTTGNCKKYEVIESSSNGIGCISLPGTQQRSWLLGTIIALTIAFCCQVIDVFLLMCMSSDTEWRCINSKRPWATILGGLAMLIVLIAFGVFNADNLPKGVTEAIWIYRKEASRATGRVCQGSLNPPGLRGVMIGYMDSLFGSWGGVYLGKS